MPKHDCGQKGHSVAEYALILIVVAVVVIIIVILLGPSVTNVFNQQQSLPELGIVNAGKNVAFIKLDLNKDPGDSVEEIGKAIEDWEVFNPDRQIVSIDIDGDYYRDKTNGIWIYSTKKPGR